MANKYKYDLTFDDKHDEEDRECLNDLYRNQGAYYNTLNKINNIFLETLNNMTQDEIKDVLMHKYIIPVERLK